MKLLRSIGIALAVVTLLQACGGSGKSTAKSTEPKEVHIIKPNKVASYVDAFKAQNSQVHFELEGKQYDIIFSQFSQDKVSAYAYFELGYLVFGFDEDKQTPIANVSVAKVDGTGGLMLASLAITVKSEGDNYIYEGTVVNPTTDGIFDVRLVINESIFNAGSSTLKVVDNTAILNGTLGTQAYVQINDLINNNPSVDTLILEEIDGSINDAINMHTGRLIRKAKLTTVIPANGDVNSGGVDLFAAGFKREYHEGGKVGVHSWSENGKSAHLFAKGDAAHGPQLTYFRELLGKELGPDFYFFTINAAPAATVHHMTQTELTKYLITQ
jgi:hypothetical protein